MTILNRWMRRLFKKDIAKDTIFLRWVGLVIAILSFSHFLTFLMLGMDAPSAHQEPLHAHHGQPPSLPKLFWLGAVLQFCGVVYLVWLGSRVLVKPIKSLADAAQTFNLKDGESFTAIAEMGSVETRQAARVFNQMAERIQAQMAQKQQFLLAISHDVRTPLTRMKLRIEQLNQLDQVNAEILQQKLADDIQEMSHLLDQTLVYFRQQPMSTSFINIENGVLNRELIDITSLLQSLVDDSQDLGLPVQFLENDSTQGELTQGVIIYADVIAIKRCLNNLIDNALRYANAAHIKLLESTNNIEIQVIDDGMGIPEHLLTQVVQPFVRVEASRNVKTGGFGLGLAIAKQIIEGHDGQLLLTNIQPQGLCACIILPKSLKIGFKN
jgi:signal transduction histidine kinase